MGLYLFILIVIYAVKTGQLYSIPQRINTSVGFQVRLFSIFQLWSAFAMLVIVTRTPVAESNRTAVIFFVAGLMFSYYLAQWLQCELSKFFVLRTPKQLNSESATASYLFSMIVLGDNLQDDRCRWMASLAVKIRLSHLPIGEGNLADRRLLDKCQTFLRFRNFDLISLQQAICFSV